MKQLAFVALLLIPTAALAEEEDAPSLMEQGMELFFEGLRQEMEPAIEGLESFAQGIGPAMAEMMEQMGPAFAELMERVDDLSNYESPEMMPNGDIIIRRKPDAPEFTLPEIGEGGAVEL